MVSIDAIQSFPPRYLCHVQIVAFQNRPVGWQQGMYRSHQVGRLYQRQLQYWKRIPGFLELVNAMENHDPHLRPSAEAALRKLNSIIDSLPEALYHLSFAGESQTSLYPNCPLNSLQTIGTTARIDVHQRRHSLSTARLTSRIPARARISRTFCRSLPRFHILQSQYLHKYQSGYGYTRHHYDSCGCSRLGPACCTPVFMFLYTGSMYSSPPYHGLVFLIFNDRLSLLDIGEM
jgi:hypothetical protein